MMANEIKTDKSKLVKEAGYVLIDLKKQAPIQRGVSQSDPVLQAQDALKKASFKAVTHMKTRLNQPNVTPDEIKQAQETLQAIKTWLNNPTNDKALAAVADVAEKEGKLSSSPEEKRSWGAVALTALTVVLAVAFVFAAILSMASMVVGEGVDLISPIVNLHPMYTGRESTSTPQQEMKTAVEALRNANTNIEVESGPDLNSNTEEVREEIKPGRSC